jgi:hypothetical protein
MFEEGNMAAYRKAITNPKLFNRIEALLPRDYSLGSKTYTELMRIINTKLAHKCKFPSQILDIYKKRKLDENTKEHKGILEVVTSHLKHCRECQGTYSVRWVPPK